jgi:small subunit ribosomal protein S4
MLQAQGSRGPAGEALLELLERRLDNVVFRAGFARTIPAARQLVCHGHILINGKRVDIPSYLIRSGDVLSLSQRSQELTHVVASLANTQSFETPWLSKDPATKSARVTELPGAGSVLFPLEVQLVVEFYSQKI